MAKWFIFRAWKWVFGLYFEHRHPKVGLYFEHEEINRLALKELENGPSEETLDPQGCKTGWEDLCR